MNSYHNKNTTEQIFLESLVNLPLHQKYNQLQRLVDFIKLDVSAGTTKQYFDNLFIYFLLEGAPLDYTQKKIRLSFPRKAITQFEPLNADSIKITMLKGICKLSGLSIYTCRCRVEGN